MNPERAGGLGNLRAEVAKALPQQAALALAHYQTFVAQDPPQEAKAFGAHFSAAKACLAHLDALIRLIDWAEGPESTPEDDLLAEARRALSGLDHDEPE